MKVQVKAQNRERQMAGVYRREGLKARALP